MCAGASRGSRHRLPGMLGRGRRLPVRRPRWRAGQLWPTCARRALPVGARRAARLPRGHDVGVRAGPDPRHEGGCELWRSFQGQSAAAQRLQVADPLQVYLDQACRVGAGDDVLDVPGPVGAQLRGWLAQQQPVAVPGPVPQLKPHHDRPVRQLPGVHQLGGRPPPVPGAAGCWASWSPAAWRRCSSNSPACRPTASPTQQRGLRSPPGTTPSQPRPAQPATASSGTMTQAGLLNLPVTGTAPARRATERLNVPLAPTDRRDGPSRAYRLGAAVRGQFHHGSDHATNEHHRGIAIAGRLRWFRRRGVSKRSCRCRRSMAVHR